MKMRAKRGVRFDVQGIFEKTSMNLIPNRRTRKGSRYYILLLAISCEIGGIIQCGRFSEPSTPARVLCLLFVLLTSGFVRGHHTQQRPHTLQKPCSSTAKTSSHFNDRRTTTDGHGMQSQSYNPAAATMPSSQLNHSPKETVTATLKAYGLAEEDITGTMQDEGRIKAARILNLLIHQGQPGRSDLDYPQQIVTQPPLFNLPHPLPLSIPILPNPHPQNLHTPHRPNPRGFLYDIHVSLSKAGAAEKHLLSGAFSRLIRHRYVRYLVWDLLLG